MTIQQNKPRLMVKIWFVLLLVMGFLYISASPVQAKWILKTNEGTPNVSGWTQWGQNGYALVNKGGDLSYLYIYGQHYRDDSTAKPTTYQLKMLKWNVKLNRMDIDLPTYLSTTYYNGRPTYFYSGDGWVIANFEDGAYMFKHKATIGGETHEGDISRKITYSNWITVGKNKATLFYFDSENQESKMRVREVSVKSEPTATTANATNGLVLTVKAAMIVSDGGYDTVTFDTNKVLVPFGSSPYWHVYGDDSTSAVGTTLSLKNASGKEIYSTSSGTEGALSYNSKNKKWRYQKAGMTIPLTTLKGLANGTYSFDLAMTVKSPRGGSSTTSSKAALGAPTETKSFTMVANDGATHKYTFTSSDGKAVLIVSDATPPTYSFSQTPTGWTNGNVKITLTGMSDKGGSGYYRTLLPNGSYSTATAPTYTVSSNRTYSFTAYDNAGNAKTQSHKVSNIDKVAPTVTLSVNGNSTYAKSYSTKVTASDTLSGLKSLSYAWHTTTTSEPAASSWVSLTNNATVTTPKTTGKYFLWVRVTDNAGNVTTFKSNVFAVDTTLPSVTMTPNNGAWQKTPHVITPSYSDGHSGIKTKQYAWSTSTTTPTTWNNYTSGTIRQPNVGTYYLHYKAVDQAGNERVGYVGPYRYETSAPTGKVSQSPTDWTNGEVVLTLNNVVDTGGSGLKNITLPNGVTTSGTTASFAATSNGTYTFIMTDNAGNQEKASIDVSNIDKTPPSVSYLPNGSTAYIIPSSIKVTANDTASGVQTVKYAWSQSNSIQPTEWKSFQNGGNVPPPTTSGSHYLWIIAEDKAGNSITTKSNVFLIDVDPPTAQTSQTPTGFTRGEVTLKIENIRDVGGSGYDRTKEPDGKYSSLTNFKKVVTQNGQYVYEIYDKVGNKATINFNVQNIDKEGPVIRYEPNGTNGYVKSAKTKVTVTDTKSGVDNPEYAWSTSKTGTPTTWTPFKSGSYIETPTQNGIYYLWVKAVDNVGNVTMNQSNPFHIDNEDPKVLINPMSGDWKKTPHQINMQISNQVGTIPTIYYAWSSNSTAPSKWQTAGKGTSSFTQPEEGILYFHYKVVSEAGSETIGYTGPYRYDTTGPTGNIVVTPKEWTNQNVTLSAEKVQDQWAGLKEIRLPDGRIVTKEKDTEFIAVKNGTYTFTFVDAVGNETKKTVSVSNIDKEAPNTTVSQSPTDWTNENVKITLSSIQDSAQGSGYTRTQLPDKSYSTKTTVSYDVAQNGKYIFVLYDLAGNQRTITHTVSNIDKIRPRAEFSSFSVNNGLASLVVNATDEESGIDWILLPNGTFVYQNEATYSTSDLVEVKFVIKDKAGNMTVLSKDLSEIDTTPPTLILEASPGDWTNQPITIHAIARDESGIREITLPNGQKVRDSKATFVVTENTNFTFKAKDLFDNETTETITITNYDPQAPKAEIRKVGETEEGLDVQLEYGDR